MKKTVFLLVSSILSVTVIAQKNEFEGTAVYKVDVKSKMEGATDKAWRNMLVLGDSITVIIKQGNYRQSSGITDIYFISKDEKAYLRFKGIDTLFYLDYSSDTSTVLNVLKSEAKKNIAGYECKSITIRGRATTWNYYYSPSLYINPEYDKNNRLGRYDAFVKETSSLYLSSFEENASYTVSQTCTRLLPGNVEKNVFELPNLPSVPFSAGSITTPPKFARAGGFEKYLYANLDASLGAKYIKIPKGEESAMQTAIVAFMINDRGRVMNAQLVNKGEVHPKLAEEAIRVVSGSPVWVPADILGGKIIFWYKQPVSFQASKK